MDCWQISTGFMHWQILTLTNRKDHFIAIEKTKTYFPQDKYQAWILGCTLLSTQRHTHTHTVMYAGYYFFSTWSRQVISLSQSVLFGKSPVSILWEQPQLQHLGLYYQIGYVVGGSYSMPEMCDEQVVRQ